MTDESACVSLKVIGDLMVIAVDSSRRPVKTVADFGLFSGQDGWPVTTVAIAA